MLLYDLKLIKSYQGVITEVGKKDKTQVEFYKKEQKKIIQRVQETISKHPEWEISYSKNMQRFVELYYFKNYSAQKIESYYQIADLENYRTRLRRMEK